MEQTIEQEMIIIRGLPGSGKSTFAKKNFGSYIRCEADDYFYDVDGSYNFNPKNISKAHESCYNRVKDALISGKSVVVSNTFTMLWEIAKYENLAKEIGCKLKVIRLNTMYGNIHDVTNDTILKMKNRFEDFDGEIVVK